MDFTLTLESEAICKQEIELQEIEIDPLEEIESDVNQIASEELQDASKSNGKRIECRGRTG